MLDIENLSIRFTRYGPRLSREVLAPVKSLDLRLRAGEVLAVVGASGSGKSLLAHAVLGILPGNCRVEGTMRFDGAPLTAARQRALRGKRIVLAPQSVSYLNPLVRLGRQVRRAAILSGHAPRAASAVCDEAFARFGLAPQAQRQYPFQVSGGMARRVLTATATLGAADLIIVDEPTTGLHKEATTESLGHLRRLADSGKAVLVITHDVNAVLAVADKVCVFFEGVTAELATAADFREERLRHPYTRALWRALPDHDFTAPVSFSAVNDEEAGCAYAGRCERADDECRETAPKLRACGHGLVRCCHA